VGCGSNLPERCEPARRCKGLAERFRRLEQRLEDKLTDHDFSHAVPSARARGCWRVAVAAYGWLAHLLSRVSGFAAEFRLNSQEEQRTRENVMGRLISLLFVAIAACCAQAAHAAATEVENISDPTWQPYQVYGSTNCTLPGVCALPFPAITTNRTLVTHVSCRFSMSTTYGYVVYAELNVGPVEPLAGPFNNLPLFTFSSSKGGVTLFGINAETYFFFATGDVPTVVIEASEAAPGNVICTLDGYYKS
jgi:hypothetical protein